MPVVAIVGRPNVGKSTLFNKIAGKRISIVKNQPGITRDRVAVDAEWCGNKFLLLDTGGLELKNTDVIVSHIREQVNIAIDLADVIIFLLDGLTTLTSEDFEVASFLRKSNKPVLVGVNKLDNNEVELLSDFYALGFSDVFALSAEHSKGLGDLLDAVCENFKDIKESQKSIDAVNIAFVGKPNVGKSSIVNKLLGYKRVIVSDIPGTTRDSIDTLISCGDKKYNLIDTAGMRKKTKVKDDVEYYSNLRSVAAIERADVVCIVIDAVEGVTEQDVKLCALIHERGKPSVILINKWDLIEKNEKTAQKVVDDLKIKLKFMDYMEVNFISALTGKRMNTIFKKVDEVFEESQKRISTGVLNRLLRDAVLANEPPLVSGRRLLIYYISQVSNTPITFIIYVNDPKLMHFAYERYLLNSIRETLNFKGCPIKLVVKARGSKE